MKQILFAGLMLIALNSYSKNKAPIELSDARIFAPLKGSNATAGYVTIKNTSKKEVTLTLAKVEPFAAVELHETIEKDGRMSMQKIEKFIIKAGQGLELKPGSNHIMLFDPTKEVKPNDILKVIFLIDGKETSFDFKVISRLEKKEESHHH